MELKQKTGRELQPIQEYQRKTPIRNIKPNGRLEEKGSLISDVADEFDYVFDPNYLTHRSK